MAIIVNAFAHPLVSAQYLFRGAISHKVKTISGTAAVALGTFVYKCPEKVKSLYNTCKPLAQTALENAKKVSEIALNGVLKYSKIGLSYGKEYGLIASRWIGREFVVLKDASGKYIQAGFKYCVDFTAKNPELVVKCVGGAIAGLIVIATVKHIWNKFHRPQAV